MSIIVTIVMLRGVRRNRLGILYRIIIYVVFCASVSGAFLLGEFDGSISQIDNTFFVNNGDYLFFFLYNCHVLLFLVVIL